MDEYFQKKLYVYRKSYNFYNKISISLSISKFIFSASGLCAFAILPLAGLSLGAAFIEVIDKSLNISERKEEYKQTYKLYKQLQNLLKCNAITEQEIYIREQDFINNLVYFPLEKYVKKVQLNCYKYTK